MCVCSVGTGGTITGIARKIKERCPNVIVVGVDPEGSILAQPENLNDKNRLQSYKVEGIGYDFIPDVLNRSLVDRWEKTNDQESFIMARRLIREEGLLCGGSCGSAMAAAVRAASTLKQGQRCVVLLPDSTRNYMTKFLSDQWMFANQYVDNTVHTSENYLTFRKDLSPWWAVKTVSALGLSPPSTVSPSMTCNKAIELMEKHGFDQLPVVKDDGVPCGVVTIGNLLSRIALGRAHRSDPVSAVMFSNFTRVTNDSSLADLAQIFDKDYFALVTAHRAAHDTVVGLVTRIDLLNFITTSSAE